MKKPTCYCFTWMALIAFIELNFTVAFLLLRKTWDGRFVGNQQQSVHPPHISASEGGESREGLLGKRGVIFFRVGSVFT